MTVPHYENWLWCDAVLADPWDCFDTKHVFSRPAELVAANSAH